MTLWHSPRGGYMVAAVLVVAALCAAAQGQGGMLEAQLKEEDVAALARAARELGDAEAGRYAIKTWSLKRTANYGSQHYDEKPLAVDAAELLADRKTVRLRVSKLKPTWGMEIVCRIKGADGSEHERTIHNSVFALGE